MARGKCRKHYEAARRAGFTESYRKALTTYGALWRRRLTPEQKSSFKARNAEYHRRRYVPRSPHWTRPPRNNTGYKGVNFDKKKALWQVRIWHGGKRNCLGYYEEKEDAALAYNVAAQLIHGSPCYLNPV